MNTDTIIRALLVDDEKPVRTALHDVLTKNFPQIHVVGEAGAIPEAVREINQHKPDLVFLDIAMPGYSGLQLLDFFNPDEITFDIIFVTAFNEYAIQAFKISAFDYLLKPVNTEELERTLERYMGKMQKQKKVAERAALLNASFSENHVLTQLAIRSLQSVDFVQLSNIVMLEASGTYTQVVLHEGEPLLASKPLGEFEEVLQHSPQFFRAHRSFLINLQYVSRLASKEGDVIIMNNKQEVPLSRYRKKEFEQAIARFKI